MPITDNDVPCNCQLHQLTYVQRMHYVAVVFENNSPIVVPPVIVSMYSMYSLMAAAQKCLCAELKSAPADHCVH